MDVGPFVRVLCCVCQQLCTIVVFVLSQCISVTLCYCVEQLCGMVQQNATKLHLRTIHCYLSPLSVNDLNGEIGMPTTPVHTQPRSSKCWNAH